MTKIKICGLNHTEDISYVNELLPDFAGFVFAKSSRQVDAKKAAELKKQLSPKIKAVGVFVNAEPEFIAKLYQKLISDLAQLHGDETADYIHRLKNLCPSLPLIKAVRVQIPTGSPVLLYLFRQQPHPPTYRSFWIHGTRVCKPVQILPAEYQNH